MPTYTKKTKQRLLQKLLDFLVKNRQKIRTKFPTIVQQNKKPQHIVVKDKNKAQYIVP